MPLLNISPAHRARLLVIFGDMREAAEILREAAADSEAAESWTDASEDDAEDADAFRSMLTEAADAIEQAADGTESDLPDAD